MPRGRTQDAWDRANSIGYSLRFMKRTEADIISKLEEQENKSGYIKKLIRQDMRKSRIFKYSDETTEFNGQIISRKIYGIKRYTATVENISYNFFTNELCLTLKGFNYQMFAKEEDFVFADIGEVPDRRPTDLVVGGEISFDYDGNGKTRHINNIVIISDRIRKLM